MRLATLPRPAALLAGIAAAALISLTACGNNTVASPAPSATAASASQSASQEASASTEPTDSATEEATDEASDEATQESTGDTTTTQGAGKGDTITVDGKKVTNVPTGLTFPDGATVNDLQVTTSAGRVNLSAPSTAEATKHFTAVLKSQGYDVTVATPTVVTATGKGWTISITGIGQGTDVSWSHDG